MSNFCYKSGINIRIWSINSGCLPLKTFLYHFATVDAENDTLKHTRPPKKNHNTAIIKVDSYMAACCRYQIWCAPRVSGITLFRYAQNLKIGKSNDLKFWK